MSFVSPSSPNDKNLGAFYTAREVAEFLVRWAVRTPQDRVLDPSFGGGVFLDAACRNILSQGGRPHDCVYGAEVDADACGMMRMALHKEYGIPPRNLHHMDFFAIGPDTLAPDAVVGNPPFIRYQRFAGEARSRALAVAASAGVALSELCSSWAPFVVHATTILRDHGRLGFVLPVEVMHAAYARPVLEFLANSYASITFLTFRRRLFPDLSQDTLLLLAENKSEKNLPRIRMREMEDAASLSTIPTNGARALARRTLALGQLVAGTDRFAKQFLPKRVRQLYDELARHPKVLRLGEIADVGIGYVTGGNDFFHLSQQEAEHWGIPRGFLRPAVCRGRALRGLLFSSADWAAAEKTRDAALLLHVTEVVGEKQKGLLRYLQHGEARGVHEAFKCRIRTPWYRVPHVRVPDAFLAYMSGTFPSLVVNEAATVAPNTLHIVRLRPLIPASPYQLAVGWQSSLTHLSAEIEGHAMGGGMLKLEPTEAERVLVAMPEATAEIVRMHAITLHKMARAGNSASIQSTVDNMVLHDVIGLDKGDCVMLRQATDSLRRRRMPRA